VFVVYIMIDNLFRSSDVYCTLQVVYATCPIVNVNHEPKCLGLSARKFKDDSEVLVGTLVAVPSLV
jgi:hypothetical protein